QQGRPSSVLAMAGGDPTRVTLDMVTGAAEEGDLLATEKLRAAALQIGLAVSNAVTLLNPRMVVLSGSLVHSSRLMFETIEESIRSQTFVSPNALETVSVVRAHLGPLAGAVGAAGVVHQRRTGLYDGVRVVGT
ncbi:MAG TPA: ROK family protein, partial [Chloroflexota bacterium]|nr:ROK family protein [Chloroflexota bacterium]